jgi:hypothetical protein
MEAMGEGMPPDWEAAMDQLQTWRVLREEAEGGGCLCVDREGDVDDVFVGWLVPRVMILSPWVHVMAWMGP